MSKDYVLIEINKNKSLNYNITLTNFLIKLRHFMIRTCIVETAQAVHYEILPYVQMAEFTRDIMCDCMNATIDRIGISPEDS